jgi:hypothetical protein
VRYSNIVGGMWIGTATLQSNVVKAVNVQRFDPVFYLLKLLLKNNQRYFQINVQE